MENIVADTVDARGLCCPMPTVKTALALKRLNHGEVLEILTNDPASKRDLPAWAETTGNKLLALREENYSIKIYIEKNMYG